MDLPYPASTYKLCEKDEAFCAVNFHIVKLHASGCSVISDWDYRNQLLYTNHVKKMKNFLCCSRNFPDVHVVKLNSQGYSVICHWIYHLQT
jgi:hypothetical protein